MMTFLLLFQQKMFQIVLTGVDLFYGKMRSRYEQIITGFCSEWDLV